MKRKMGLLRVKPIVLQTTMIVEVVNALVKSKNTTKAFEVLGKKIAELEWENYELKNKIKIREVKQ